MLESKFQSDLIKELHALLPGAIITKMDANVIQGIPDLIILYGPQWAVLECKKESNASHQPNQDYYIEKMNAMSFASFISPQNKEAVINELLSAFGVER